MVDCCWWWWWTCVMFLLGFTFYFSALNWISCSLIISFNHHLKHCSFFFCSLLFLIFNVIESSFHCCVFSFTTIVVKVVTTLLMQSVAMKFNYVFVLNYNNCCLTFISFHFTFTLSIHSLPRNTHIGIHNYLQSQNFDNQV